MKKIILSKKLEKALLKKICELVEKKVWECNKYIFAKNLVENLDDNYSTDTEIQLFSQDEIFKKIKQAFKFDLLQTIDETQIEIATKIQHDKLVKKFLSKTDKELLNQINLDLFNTIKRSGEKCVNSKI